MQGAYAELNKFLSRSVQNYIITSRVVQGERDLQHASEGEKANIIYRWNHDKTENIQESGLEADRPPGSLLPVHFRMDGVKWELRWKKSRGDSDRDPVESQGAFPCLAPPPLRL
jgi:hypothetical protein